jgi:hypothetical protein
MNTPELTADEEQALREALGEAPPTEAHAARREQIRAEMAMIQSALMPPASDEPVPQHVLARLRAHREKVWQEHQARHSSALAFSEVQSSAPGTSTTNTRLLTSLPWLALAAVIAVLAIAAKLLLPTADPTRPTIAWTNATDPEQKYDVWILPDNNIHKEDAEVLFVATNVRSPVKFDQLTAKAAGRDRLEKDKSHRLLVCLASAGRFAGEAVKFTPQAEITSPTPTAPGMLRILLADKRIREARQLLAALPESVREDPAVLELAKQVPP